MPGTQAQVFPELKSDLHQAFVVGNCVCVGLAPATYVRCFFLPSSLFRSLPYLSVPDPVPCAKDTEMVQE